ncbi:MULTISPECIES: hypothetical protein [Flavobacterium]|uniref:Uncharacterized protein n=1 Tax=Flavobacterium faecale TaxID=1355330 RepID=A0A2S1LGK2_9FLAO|nr:MULTISPECIES: hypothetical protein [Flavobacterium]AWG22828.1 hypothetical protein FFWV33_15480 [Flavobacterium faecale]MBE0393244.1 hypothetical protein [Flavobacterium sp. PL002]
MKNLFLGLFVVLVMISCSTDEYGNTIEEVNSVSAQASTSKTIGPANNANPYDEVGKEYGFWLSEYYQIHGYSKTIQDLATQVNYIGAKLKAPDVLGKSNILITEDGISISINNPETVVISTLASGTLSEAAESSLLGFFVSLIQNREAEYNLLYDFITTYEAGIMDSSNLTSFELETILGITSVTRYALDAEGGHKDRDWEISVGNKKVASGFHPFQASLISVIANLRYYL